MSLAPWLFQAGVVVAQDIALVAFLSRKRITTAGVGADDWDLADHALEACSKTRLDQQGVLVEDLHLHDDVPGLRAEQVHVYFPEPVAGKSDDWDEDDGPPPDGRAVHHGVDAHKLAGDVDGGPDAGVDDDEDEPHEHAQVDGQVGPQHPCLDDHGSLDVDGHQHHGEDGGAEPPLPCRLPIRLHNILLEDPKRQPEQDRRVEDGIDGPGPEHTHVEMTATLACTVETGVAHEDLVTHVLVEDTDGKRRQHREDHVVQRDGPLLEKNLAREAVHDSEPELDEVEGDVLVEGVEDELGQAPVGPCTVDEQQALEEAELPNGIVCSTCRLQALLPADADTNVRCLDHAHVVGPIANSEGDGLDVPHVLCVDT
eukprot:Colp12_sorted_trinity150504_noHs@27698